MNKAATTKLGKKQMMLRSQAAQAERGIMSLLPKRRQGLMARASSAPKQAPGA